MIAYLEIHWRSLNLAHWSCYVPSGTNLLAPVSFDFVRQQPISNDEYTSVFWGGQNCATLLQKCPSWGFDWQVKMERTIGCFSERSMRKGWTVLLLIMLSISSLKEFNFLLKLYHTDSFLVFWSCSAFETFFAVSKEVMEILISVAYLTETLVST